MSCIKNGGRESILRLWVASILLVPAHLQANFDSDFRKCASVEEDRARLVCFDQLGSRLNAAGSVEQAPPVAEQKVKVVYIEKAKEEPKEINANLIGDFKGWNRNSTFKLDNGQIWRAIKGSARDKVLRRALSNPPVKLTRGSFGSWSLRVEGVSGRLKVKKIK